MNPTEADYAGLPRRLLAALIDNLTWLTLFIFGVGPFITALGDANEAAGIAAFIAYASLWFNYFIFMEWRTGRTLGKLAAEIEVRSLDGAERLSFAQASVRGLLRIVDFFLIGWVMVAATDRKQRLGDKAARTVVVQKETETITVPPAVRGAAVPPAAAGAKAAAPSKSNEEKESRLPEIPWDAGDAGWGLVAGLILAVVVTPFLVLPFDPDLSSDGALLAAQALLGGSLLFVALGMASRWKRAELGEAVGRLGLQNFRWSGLGIGFLTWVGYIIAAVIFSALVLQPDQEDIGAELGIGDDNVLVAVSAVLLIVGLAPLSEELFFRGFVFAGLRKRFSLWPAALIAGGIFGLIHATTGITTVIPLAGLGIALCWLYDRTGSLWPCVFVHFINNALALLLTT